MELITVTEAGIVAKVGMNRHKVGVTLNALKTVQMDCTQVPIHIALRLVLESTSTLAALEKLEIVGVASAAHFLISDPVNTLGLEVSPLGFGVIKPNGTGAVYHTNHCVAQVPSELREVPWLTDSGPRLARIEQLVRPIEHLSFDKIKSVLSDEEDGYPTSINRACDDKGISTVFTLVCKTSKDEAILEVTFGRPTETEENFRYDFINS